ncbi:hypothetical protein DFR74_11333 [Nocardia puris]|uniref:Uncharacterized protein n=1 Tax=Nocardia puris TaxID=208602 RepID=A0A366D8W3_9NOCA|nr:hypothetical protein DFR74_11333 [Nocardia puris]
MVISRLGETRNTFGHHAALAGLVRCAAKAHPELPCTSGHRTVRDQGKVSTHTKMVEPVQFRLCP